MPKRSANEYESGDGFVVDDNGSASPPPQHSKRTKTNGSASSSGNNGLKLSKEALKDEDGNDYWELSAMRRVTLNEFKGKTLVNVREYYEANGKKLPGKKGISMSIEQFSALIGALPQIELALEKRGESIPRPGYGDDVGDVDAAVVTKAPAASAGKSVKGEKQNFEETSDEDEG